MLDPRIYRMSLLLPVIALLVLAFSLTAQPGARQPGLAPGAFDGAAAARTMHALQRRYPDRTPGSADDRRLARALRADLGAPRGGFSAVQRTGVLSTPHGARSSTEVLATRQGTASGEGAVLVLAPRDAPGPAGVSGTAMLLGLAHVLGGQTLQRTVVLASVGDVAGARHLAATLGEPIDAAIVLGDVAGAGRRAPVVLPWSGREALAPAALRNTLASAFAAQTGTRAGEPDIVSQFAHLAFPLTVSAQAPFIDRGVPAVELSLSGDRIPSAGEPVGGAGRLGGVGRAVVATLSALDATGAVAAPSSYMVVSGQVLPSWVVSLVVLAFILPVLLTTIDGLARARRRRYGLRRALWAVLAAAGPFLAAALVIVVGGAVGALPASVDPLAPGAVAPSGGAIAVMAVALLAALGAAAAARPLWARLGPEEAPDALPVSRRRRGAPTDAAESAWCGVSAVTLLVMCVVALLVWLADPFAAALLLPALHLMLWALDRDLPLPGAARIAMLLLGAVPVAGLVVLDAHALGFTAPGLAWEAVLLLGGHAVSWVAMIEWSLALGCLTGGLGLVVLHHRAPELPATRPSVRGPVSYAGPGSLGGTKSALRR